jgi:hypothetical protein
MEMGISPGAAGLLGGMGGGIAQAYTTMGTCTLSLAFCHLLLTSSLIIHMLDNANQLLGSLGYT